MKNGFLSLVLVAFCLVLITETSKGIPAFARKYKTSCATCHTGFPKLNAFGEAFRRNGYQFPGGTDAEFTKEEPVSMGSEGNKRAFPDAIWPGSIPGSSPVSLFFNGEVDYNPKTDPRFTLDGLGTEIETSIGATVGEDVSLFGEFAIHSSGEAELDRAFVIFSNLIGSSYALNMRVGEIEPGVLSFSNKRAWLKGDDLQGFWIMTRAFSDDMGWTIEGENQKGMEVNGMAGGRFGYSAGIVEGFGAAQANASNMDYYEHVTYKFGGLPLDGVTKNGPAPDNPKPYIDNSLTLGAFAYEGSAVIGPDTMLQTNSFTMFGGDFNAWYDRFNLFGGVGIRKDDQPYVGVLNRSANTTVWFTELDVVTYPWLLPALRLQSYKSQNLDPITGTQKHYNDIQIAPGIIFLIRPNVKMTLRTEFTKYDSNNDTKFQFGKVLLKMGVGM
jgi:hypothetical protein